MEELFYCAEGHTTYFDTSPTKGDLIATYDIEGTPLVYVVVKDKADKEALIGLIEAEQSECLVCAPPPALSPPGSASRIIVYQSTCTPEEKAARIKRRVLFGDTT